MRLAMLVERLAFWRTKKRFLTATFSTERKDGDMAWVSFDPAAHYVWEDGKWVRVA